MDVQRLSILSEIKVHAARDHEIPMISLVYDGSSTSRNTPAKNRSYETVNSGWPWLASHTPVYPVLYNNNIIPFGLPPHLTHLLQPLDVVVFQPLKHYHAKALDILVRDGCVTITKIEFLACIEGVRRQAFKKTTILSAFKKTGINPWNPNESDGCCGSKGSEADP